MRRTEDLFWAWRGALSCFILAGATGALFRFGLIRGLPAGLQLADVRHAHSHLMHFGWVTPALMALIALRLPDLTGRPFAPGFRRAIGLTLVLALLAYPLFLLYGYRVAEVGGRRLPLSVLAASLNILAWYAFGWLYLRATWRAPRRLPLRLWDAALVFQALASLGAWGRAVLVALKVTDPFWEAALVHLFLDLFSDGWFLLALLGLAYAAHPAASSRWGTRLVLLGLPATFLLGLPVDQVPPGLRLVAGGGGALVAVGLMGHLRALWPRARSPWRWPLFFLGLKALAELAVSLPAGALWAEGMGLRVSYLHWTLLGFVTLGLLAAAQEAWGAAAVHGARGLTAAVLLLLASLIPLTNLWPAAWSGRWAAQAAAWATLIPLAAGLGMLLVALGRTPDGSNHVPADVEPHRAQT